MADMSLRIDTEVDDAAVQDAFRRVMSRVENPREVLDDIGQQWVTRTHHRFDAGGYPDRWKRKLDGSASHLRDRGDLERSIHHRTRRRSVTIGTRHRSARAHQEGMIIRPRRRRYLSVPLKKGRQYQAGAGAFFRRYPGRVFSYFPDPSYGVVMRTFSGRRDAEPIFLLVKKVEIDARPFLLCTREDRAAFVTTIESYYTRSFR